MKLTLNTTEVQEAVAQYMVAHGFPIDMNQAELESNSDGTITITINPQETTVVTKPKAKKKKETTVEPVEEKHEEIEETQTDEKDLFIKQLDEVTEPVEQEVQHETTARPLFG